MFNLKMTQQIRLYHIQRHSCRPWQAWGPGKHEAQVGDWVRADGNDYNDYTITSMPLAWFRTHSATKSSVSSLVVPTKACLMVMREESSDIGMNGHKSTIRLQCGWVAFWLGGCWADWRTVCARVGAERGAGGGRENGRKGGCGGCGGGGLRENSVEGVEGM